MAQKPQTAQKDATAAMSEAMAQFQKMGFDTMSAMSGGWMQKMNELNTEILHFIAERMQKDLEFQQRLMQCRDPKELHALQTEFIQTMIDRYTEETGKLIDMTTKAMSPPDPKG